MSSVPPLPPPSYFPPPPPPPRSAVPAGSIPWESQPLGLSSFIETVKLFITAPAEAWRRTPEKGDMFKPLLYSVIVGWIGVLLNSAYSMFLSHTFMSRSTYWMNNMPPKFHRLLILVAPILVVIGLFVSAAILHVCFMIVGSLSTSTSGFEGTFRIVAYSGVAHLAHLAPFVGGILSTIWFLVLTVMGAVALHRTTQGKAVAGVLIPIVLCCVCFSVIIAIGLARWAPLVFGNK